MIRVKSELSVVQLVHRLLSQPRSSASLFASSFRSSLSLLPPVKVEERRELSTLSAQKSQKLKRFRHTRARSLSTEFRFRAGSQPEFPSSDDSQDSGKSVLGAPAQYFDMTECWPIERFDGTDSVPPSAALLPESGYTASGGKMPQQLCRLPFQCRAQQVAMARRVVPASAKTIAPNSLGSMGLFPIHYTRRPSGTAASVRPEPPRAPFMHKKYGQCKTTFAQRHL